MKMKRGKSRNARVRVGLAFYTADEWRILKQVVSDPDRLDNTYEDWQQNLENLERRLQKDGVAFKRVSVRIEELVNWCTEQGVPIDGEARSRFAAYLLEAESD